MGNTRPWVFQRAASEGRAAVSSRVPSIFVTAIVSASSVSHAARVIPMYANSSPGVRRASTRQPPVVDQDSLWRYSTTQLSRKSERLFIAAQLAASGTLWSVHPCSTRCRSIWLCALARLNLHPGVAPPHRHDGQGCRQGSQLLHSWFESCSNTCGIVGQKFVRLNMTQKAQGGFIRARVASC